MSSGARPNILVFLTDQQRADHVGFGGNDVVRTPNLDALARSGTVFDSAYVSNPICAPNRGTIFTGTVPSAHGVRVNGIPLDPDTATWPRILRRAGWRTAAVGKLHFQNMGWERGERQELPGPERMGDAWIRDRPDGWDRWEDLERHRRERVAIPVDYYGFDHVDLVVGHSDWASGHYYQWARDRGVELDELRGSERASERFAGWEQVYRSALPEELYPTSYVTERTLARLAQLSEGPDPFLLVCSYPDPHHPFTPPGRFWGMYESAEMPVPPTFDDAHERSAPHIRRIVARRGVSDDFDTWAPTRDQLRHALAAEFGMITMIDEGIGQVLDALERSGAAENTIVVFTSDHGDMFGDHGLMFKSFSHYRACIRVPLVMRIPGTRPERSCALVGSIDLAPTLLELAGVPAHHGTHGRSMVPLLADPGGRIREAHLVEEDCLERIAGLTRPPRMRTVITERARLTMYVGTGVGELFDHDEDYEERRNLFRIAEAAALQSEMTEALAELLTMHDSTGIALTDSA